MNKSFYLILMLTFLVVVTTYAQSSTTGINDFLKQVEGRMYLYNIGIKRFIAIVGSMNLTYNMFRKLHPV